MLPTNSAHRRSSAVQPLLLSVSRQSYGLKTAKLWVKSHLQPPGFPGTLLNLRAGPTLVIGKVGCPIPFGEVDVPNRLALFGRWEVKEERTQCESASQFWWKTRYRIARRDPEAPPLRDRIDDLKRCTQSLARSANERALHR